MYAIQSLRRGISVLRSFNVDRSELGVTELSRILGLNRSVVQKLVVTFEKEGFLMQDPASRKYRIGPRILEVARVFSATDSLVREGTNQIRQLARISGMTTGIAVLDGNEVLYLAAAEAETSIRAASRAGDRRPVHATASGKCLLAFLSEIEVASVLSNLVLKPFTPRTITSRAVLLDELKSTRSRRYATSYEERAVGLIAVAAPVWDHTARANAAVTMAIPKGLLSDDRLDTYVQLTMEAAETLTSRLGGLSRFGAG